VLAAVDLGKPVFGHEGVELLEGEEASAVEQVGGDVVKRFLDLTLGLRASSSAGPGSKAVVGGERQKARVVNGLLPIPALHHHFHVVVEANRGSPSQVLEGPHVLAHGGGEVLGFDEAQVAPSRVAEDVAEGPDLRLSFREEIDLEGRVIHLRLDARPGLESDDRLDDGPRPHLSEPLFDDGVAALKSRR